MDELAPYQRLFADFAAQTTDAPLYARLAAGIADDPGLVGLLLNAPRAQRLPVLLFACVHWLLLADPSEPLARFYPNLSRGATVTGDPVAQFRRFCHAHHAELAELLATRSTQTNEIGRTALFVPAFGLLDREVGPLAHVDAGASAGLNLLIPHYDYVFDPGGTLVAGSPVRIVCATRGRVPVPMRHPAIAAAIGVDATPVDVTDAAQARWLEACVWPDQVERFDRLAAAIDIARGIGVDVRCGDAPAMIDELVHEAAASGHPVVTTSWVMNYLTADERAAFVRALDGASRRTDLSWICLESPALCPELPGMSPPRSGPKQPTALVVVRWRGGDRTATHVADCHPHGRWIHWR